MEWLNYHHLLYFWTVARTGSITAAAGELRLAAPTISNQIKRLEESLGERLLKKSGRRLVLTDMGRIAMRYADEIFSLGREFTDAMRDRPTGRPLRLSVGIADVVPKVVAFRLVVPAFRMRLPTRVICREGRAEELLGKLATHELDVMLSDSPVSPGSGIRAFSHELGQSDIGFFSSVRIADKRRRFPKSLDGQRLLLPTESSVLRRDLDQWFFASGIRPEVAGEFEDFALLREFGEQGYGAFPAPAFLAKEFSRSGLRLLGRTKDIKLRFYATTVERKIEHPAVQAICKTAQDELFT